MDLGRLRYIIDAETAPLERKLDSVNKKTGETDKNMKGAESSGSSLGVGFMKLAGILGGAAAAYKGLNTVIRSTQATSDQLDAVMGGLNESMGRLAQTIARGDWSNLVSNLIEGAQAGAAYARAIDDIWDRTNSLKLAESELQIESIRAMTIAKDRAKSDEERLKAAESIIELETQYAQQALDIANASLQAELELAATRINRTELANDEMKEYIKIYGINKDILDTEATRSELAQETIRNYIRQYDANNDLLEQAEAYNNAVRLIPQYQNEAMRALRTGADPRIYNELIAAQRVVIQNTDDEVKSLAKVHKAMDLISDMAEGSRQEIVNTWVASNKAVSDFAQRTQRAEILVSQLNEEIQEKNNIRALGRVGELMEEIASKTQEIQFAETGDDIGKWRDELKLLNEELDQIYLSMRDDTELLRPIESLKTAIIEVKGVVATELPEIVRSAVDTTKEGIVDITDFLQDMLMDAMDMIGTTIGALASGGDFAALDNWLLMLADWGKKLGGIMIAAGFAASGFQKAIISNPPLAIALGAGLIAASAAVKATIQDVPQTGVNTSYGGGGSQGSDVIGIRDLGQFNVNLSGELRAQGSELVTVLNNEGERSNF